MMSRQLRKFVTLLAALLFCAGVAVAQDRYGASENAKEHGYQHGYRDGLRQGRMDLSRNVPHNFESEEYRRADFGFESYMGERDDFQGGYRSGYKEGYDDGFYGRPIRSNTYGLSENYDPDRIPRTEEDAPYYAKWSSTDVAFDTGYRDGLQAGRNDFRDHKDFKPEKHDSYEDGHHGYRKNYGDKGVYKEQFRKGFLRGYEDAFNRHGQ